MPFSGNALAWAKKNEIRNDGMLAGKVMRKVMKAALLPDPPDPPEPQGKLC